MTAASMVSGGSVWCWFVVSQDFFVFMGVFEKQEPEPERALLHGTRWQSDQTRGWRSGKRGSYLQDFLGIEVPKTTRLFLRILFNTRQLYNPRLTGALTGSP